MFRVVIVCIISGADEMSFSMKERDSIMVKLVEAIGSSVSAKGFNASSYAYEHGISGQKSPPRSNALCDSLQRAGAAYDKPGEEQRSEWGE